MTFDVNADDFVVFSAYVKVGGCGKAQKTIWWRYDDEDDCFHYVLVLIYVDIDLQCVFHGCGNACSCGMRVCF